MKFTNVKQASNSIMLDIVVSLSVNSSQRNTNKLPLHGLDEEIYAKKCHANKQTQTQRTDRHVRVREWKAASLEGVQPRKGVGLPGRHTKLHKTVTAYSRAWPKTKECSTQRT